jgi:hypothetical protein
MTKESFCLATLILVCSGLPRVEGESMVVGKIMRYAPSRSWLLSHLSSEHKRKIQRGWKHIPYKIPPPEGEGESKKKPKRDGKTTTCFPSACSF